MINSKVLIFLYYFFVFFTNTNSKKGKSILTNSYVALNFYWKSLHKQIRIEGIARKVTDQEADEEGKLDEAAQKAADKAKKANVCIPIGEGENCW